jgi:hypothetical protein
MSYSDVSDYRRFEGICFCATGSSETAINLWQTTTPLKIVIFLTYVIGTVETLVLEQRWNYEDQQL